MVLVAETCYDSWCSSFFWAGYIAVKIEGFFQSADLKGMLYLLLKPSQRGQINLLENDFLEMKCNWK